ncbi:MAG: hypothetical protein IPJ24_17445 [bacterium]|nr:hypothetical protein [bacterium]
MDSINAPWIRKEAIYARAEALLDEHGLGDDPVEADYILETVFELKSSLPKTSFGQRRCTLS